MALDKLVDSTQLDTDLTSVADAIRTKGGTSADLAFPADFVSAIEAISGGGGERGPYDWIAAGAELVQTFPTLEYALADTDFATWTPSTTSTVILTAQTLGTVTASDCDQYDYFVRQRFDFTAAYKSGATLKAIPAREITCHIVSAVRYWTNLANLSARTANSFSAVTTLNSAGFLYYNSSGSLVLMNTASYGIFAYSSPTPTIASGTSTNPTMTIKTSQINARCQNTYFATARAADLDQTNSKFKIIVDIFRAPRMSIQSGIRDEISEIYNNPL